MTRVLLIEPDRLLARTYMAALKKAGVAVTWEPDAQNAISAIDKSRPELIILELQLARHNGVEFLYELRSQSDWQNIPVLLHTLVPVSDIGLTPKLREQLGIVDYYYKPQTSLKMLVEAVQDAR